MPNITEKITVGIDSSQAVKALGDLMTKMDSLNRKMASGIKLQPVIDNQKLNELLKKHSTLNLNVIPKITKKSLDDALKGKVSNISLTIKNSKTDLQKQLNNIIKGGLDVRLNIAGLNGKGGSAAGSFSNPMAILAMLPKDERQKFLGMYLKSYNMRSKAIKKEADTRERLSEATEFRKETAALESLSKVYGIKGGLPESKSNIFSNFLSNMSSGAGNILSVLNKSLLGSFMTSQKEEIINSYIEDTDSYKKWKKNLSSTAKKNLKSFGINGETFLNFASDKEKNKALTETAKNPGAMKALGSVAAFGGAAGLLIAGIVKVADSMKKLAKESIAAADNMERLKTQLGVVFGSDIQAESAFNKIKQYSLKSPFGVETMTQQAVLLKQSGVYNSELIDVMKRIGDLASGNNDRMKSISETYARVVSSTTVTARDLRQLATAGVPAYEALTTAINKNRKDNGDDQEITQSQVRGMLQGGKVTKEDLETMLKILTDEGGRFYGSTNIGAKTYEARKQNLADAEQLRKAELGKWLSNLGASSLEQTSIRDLILSFKEDFNKNWADGLEIRNKQKDIKFSKELMSRVGDLRRKQELGTLTPAELKTLEYYNSGVMGEAQEKFLSNLNDLYVKAGGSLTGQNLMTEHDYNYLKAWIEQPKWQRTDDDKFFNRLKDVIPEGFKDLARKEQLAILDNIETYDPVILRDLKKDIEKYNKYIVATEQSAIGADSLNKEASKSNSTQSQLVQARQYFEEGQVGKYYSEQTQFYKNERLKKDLLDSINKYGYLTEDGRSKTQFNFESITSVKELNRQFKLLISESEQLAFVFEKLAAPGGKVLSVENSVKYTGVRDNLLDLATVVISDLSIPQEIKDPFVNVYEKLLTTTKNSTVPFNDLDANDTHLGGVYFERVYTKKSFDILSEAINNLTEVINPLKGDTGDSLREAFGNALAYNRFSAEGVDYINKQRTPWDYARNIGQLAGVPDMMTQQHPERVRQYYRNSVSPRQLSANIMRSLFENGFNMQDVARNISYKRDKNGNYIYGGDDRITEQIDWRKTQENFENKALAGNTQQVQGLISSYDTQMKQLSEFMAANLSGQKSFEEAKDLLPKYMQNEWSASLKNLKDGTAEFKEKTMKMADEMYNELNSKKFRAEVSAFFKGVTDGFTSQTRASMFSSYGIFDTNLMKNGLSFTQRLNIGEAMSGILDLVKNRLNDSRFKPYDNASNKEEIRSLWNMYSPETSLTDDSFKGMIESLVNGTIEIDKFGVAIDMLTKSLGHDMDTIIQAYKLKEDAANRADMVKKSSKVLDDMFGYQDMFTLLGGENKFDWSMLGKTRRQKLESWGLGIDVNGNLTGMNTGSWHDMYRGLVRNTTQETSPLYQKFANSMDEFTKLYDKFKETDSELERLESSKLLTETNQKYSNQYSAAKFEGEDKRNTLSEQLLSKIDEYSSADSYVKAMGGNAYILDNVARIQIQDYENDINKINENWKNFLEANSEIVSKVEEATGINRNDGNFFEELKKVLLSETTKANQDRFEVQYKNIFDYIDGDEKKLGKLLSLGGVNRGMLKNMFENDKSIGKILANEEGLSETEMISKLIQELSKWAIDDPFQTMLASVYLIQDATNDISKAFSEAANSQAEILKSSALSGYNTITKQIGNNWYEMSQNSMTMADASKEMSKALKGVASDLVEQTSQLLINTGLEIAQAGARSDNFGAVLGGLAMAGAGGLGNVLSGYLSASTNDKNKNDDNEKLERLKALKDNLADLIKQARDDAIQYEQELRSGTSYANNQAISFQKVNDMILTDKGVFSTSPEDTIMAMKHPENLMSHGAPNVSFSIVNETGTPMNVGHTRTSTNEDGSVDIEVVVNSIVQKGIADGSYNDAFAAMQMNNRGVQSFA